MPRVNYLDDIQTMMYAAGDCRRPLIESATIVEEIVYKQMIWFVHRAQAACDLRQDQSYFEPEDLIYILRPHPILLTRIIQKLKAKDYSIQTSKSDDVDVDGSMNVTNGNDDGEDEEEKDDASSVVVLGGTISEDKGRRIKFCKKVLDKIDPTGQLGTMIFDDPSSIDPGKSERLRRVAAYSAAMDADEYVRFSEARQVSFTKSFLNPPQFQRTGSGGCASVKKFREWLFAADPFFASQNYKPTSLTMEILNILAYEILATIMDCAFLVKRESAEAGFTSIARLSEIVESDSAGMTLPKMSPLIGTSNSQQMALLLSQKLRAKPQNRNIPFGMDRLINEAVQPWELREAVRRLRFAYGNSAHTLFENNDISSACDRVIF